MCERDHARLIPSPPAARLRGRGGGAAGRVAPERSALALASIAAISAETATRPRTWPGRSSAGSRQLGPMRRDGALIEHQSASSSSVVRCAARTEKAASTYVRGRSPRPRTRTRAGRPPTSRAQPPRGPQRALVRRLSALRPTSDDRRAASGHHSGAAPRRTTRQAVPAGTAIGPWMSRMSSPGFAPVVAPWAAPIPTPARTPDCQDR